MADTPFDCYQVEPGTKVSLARHPTRDDAAFHGTKEEGMARLADTCLDIADLQDRLFGESEQKLLVILQAMDAGGKDSTVRDVFKETNPMGVRAVAFGEPSTNELAHDFLWRIHQHVPAAGQIAIFNRSHYEDVLIVRVRNLVARNRWRRRFRHIVEFEQMLHDEGVTICKFFLHISKEEQRRQLQKRLDDPRKRWKFDPADLPPRSRWDAYMTAYEEAITETARLHAPWYIIPADRRWYRKLAVAEIVAQTLREMDPRYPPPAEGIDDIVIPD